MEMTIREAGAEGVRMAITDGMEAGKMAHRNDELTAIIEEQEKEIKLARKQNAILSQKKDALQHEVETLRRINRKYRRDRAEAYAKAIRIGKDEADYMLQGRLEKFAIFAAGMALAILLAVTLIAAMAG